MAYVLPSTLRRAHHHLIVVSALLDVRRFRFREPNFFELFVREMLSIFVSLPRSQRPGFFWQRIPGYQPLVRRALLFMREFAPNLSNNMLEV